MSKKKKQKEKQQKKSYREQKLPGWMEDAEVLEIHRKAPMIRTISEVVYSQIIGKREARQLRMTVLIPDTGAAKPAVLFFPGGGWLGAAKDRFAENRWALAEAGFVVATAEYRTGSQPRWWTVKPRSGSSVPTRLTLRSTPTVSA